MNSRIVEQGYPYFFGAVAVVATWWLGALPSSGRFDGMLTSAISVTAIFLGFLGTAKAMLLSFRSSKFSWLKSNPIVWRTLLGYLKAALLMNFWVCLASLLLLGVAANQIPSWANDYLVPLWIGAFIVSVATFYRVVSVFFTLLKSE